MVDKKYDKQLHISTVGLREWRDKSVPYSRYEPTPYKALDKLFEVYKFADNSEVVDFGVGRGRVSFYIHNRFKIPVTGIEVNELTLDEALRNKASYRRQAEHIEAPLHFFYGLAEQYEIQPTENCFYFFNPFTVKIFKQVVNNILKSVKQSPRTVDIILYYPLPPFKKYINDNTPFRLINKVNVPTDRDVLAKFLIYRYEGEQSEENDD